MTADVDAFVMTPDIAKPLTVLRHKKVRKQALYPNKKGLVGKDVTNEQAL